MRTGVNPLVTGRDSGRGKAPRRGHGQGLIPFERRLNAAEDRQGLRTADAARGS